MSRKIKTPKRVYSINLRMPWAKGDCIMNWKEISVLTEGVCVEAIAGIFQNLGSVGW